jgi:hypothetical protein
MPRPTYKKVKRQNAEDFPTSELRNPGLLPRLLDRSEAAVYCSLSPAGFSAWVRIGRIPGPINGTCRWDRKAIDAALDALSAIDDNLDTPVYDRWKAKRHAHKA